MEKSLNNMVARLEGDKVEIRWQIYFFPTMNADNALMAYDLAQKKYVCGVEKDEMRNVQKYIMYEPEVQKARHFYEENIQHFVETLNVSDGLILPETKLVAEATWTIDKDYYDRLAAEHDLPQFEVQEVENEN